MSAIAYFMGLALLILTELTQNARIKRAEERVTKLDQNAAIALSHYRLIIEEQSRTMVELMNEIDDLKARRL
jgi:hypothetical protein